jgi:hypothetical protein
MTVQELITKLQEYRADLVVFCITDSRNNPYLDDSGDIMYAIDLEWGPVTEIEMHNESGNILKIL